MAEVVISAIGGSHPAFVLFGRHRGVDLGIRMLLRDRRAWEQNPIGVSNREFDRAMHASRHEWSRRGKWPNLVHACNCCIASVQGIEANPGLHVRQGLVPSGILVEACLGTVIA